MEMIIDKKMLSDKDLVENISDYFLELSDQLKYNIKIVKSPTIMSRTKNMYPYDRGVVRKSAHVVRFEVLNNIDSMLEFLTDINRIVKRWKLKSSFHKVKENRNKIIFDLLIK